VRAALGDDVFAAVENDPAILRIEEIAVEARALLRHLAE
jgi:hypothetical protein